MMNQTVILVDDIRDEFGGIVLGAGVVDSIELSSKLPSGTRRYDFVFKSHLGGSEGCHSRRKKEDLLKSIASVNSERYKLFVQEVA